jgi:hypothetical protein
LASRNLKVILNLWSSVTTFAVAIPNDWLIAALCIGSGQAGGSFIVHLRTETGPDQITVYTHRNTRRWTKTINKANRRPSYFSKFKLCLANVGN